MKRMCKCGNVIPDRRVAVLNEMRKPLMCIPCAEANVDRVAGFMIRDHKMSGELQIVSQERADELYALSSRAGGLQVSQGVRFRTGRK